MEKFTKTHADSTFVAKHLYSSFKEDLIAALKQVANNPESVKAVQKKVGKYNWLIGKDGDAHRDTLMKLITPKALSTLVKFNNEAFGIKAIYKDTLVAQLSK